MAIVSLTDAGGAELLRLIEQSAPKPRAYVACIPARNEADHIARCLRALADEFGESLHVVLAINDTDDGTFETARRTLDGTPCTATILDLRWHAGRGGAPAARALGLALAGLVAPDAAIISTDADTIVLPGLKRTVDRAFAEGFSMVCGRIGFIPEEAHKLPPVDPARDASIRAYRDASRHLRALAFPDPDNPWPHHGNIGGANFAMTARAYLQAGPLPVVPFGEDRALRRRFEAKGLRILYSDEARVETSCRIDSRTEGGLSAELARNRTEEDPLVDEALEPPAMLLRRLRLRDAVERWTDRRAVAARLVRAGIAAERADEISTMMPRAMAWYWAETELQKSAPPRMRFSAMRRHLPGLLRLEKRAAEALIGRSDAPAG